MSKVLDTISKSILIIFNNHIYLMNSIILHNMVLHNIRATLEFIVGCQPSLNSRIWKSSECLFFSVSTNGRLDFLHQQDLLVHRFTRRRFTCPLSAKADLETIIHAMIVGPGRIRIYNGLVEPIPTIRAVQSAVQGFPCPRRGVNQLQFFTPELSKIMI